MTQTIARALILATILTVSVTRAARAEEASPAVPLYAAVGGTPTPSAADMAHMATVYQMVRGDFTPQQIATMRQHNPKLIVIKYINSTYEGATASLERDDRAAISMTRVAVLAKPIDAATTELQLQPIEKRQTLPLVASDHPGDVSKPVYRSGGEGGYVTWIRIDDELMRLEEVNETSGAVRVTRGFGESQAAAHEANANVFSAVYVGKTPKGNHPTGRHGLRYELDPAHPLSAQRLAAAIIDMMENEGFDGAWLDIMSSNPFNSADAKGNVAGTWNFATNRPYRNDEFREAQELKMHRVQQIVKERTGKFPVLVGNNIKARTFEVGKGGERMLLESTPIKPRPLDGYCVEGFAGTMKGGLEDTTLEYYLDERWMGNVQMLMAGAQAKLALHPMVANAGFMTRALEDLGPQRDAFEQYGYCSYLIGYEPDAPTRLGISAMYVEGNERFAKLHPRFTWPIGKPIERQTPENLGKYRPQGHATFVRRYDNGIVLVNASAGLDKAVPLGGAYVHPQTGERFESIDVPARSGIILLRDKAAANTSDINAKAQAAGLGDEPARAARAQGDRAEHVTDAAPWQSLFNGKDLAGWQGLEGPLDDWKVVDGVIVCPGKSSATKWIATQREFDDFELTLEFKLPPRGNSGVFIRTPLSSPARQGMEIQLIDDRGEWAKKLKPTQRSGSIYGAVAPSTQATKPAGEWQSLRILCVGDRCKVSINDTLVVDANLAELAKRDGASPGLSSKKGHIGLQNHGAAVEYRKIMVKDVVAQH